MADTDQDLMDEVREITDYTDAVLPDNKLTSVVSTAKREVQGVADANISDWYTDRDAELALFWTACLFCKIKAGELDGVTMSLGDMETESLKSAGDAEDDKPVIWYERAMQYSRRKTPEGGSFGHRSMSRTGRNYDTDLANNF